jgi:hypothetical protein
MSKRKPSGMSWGGFIEQQIREAQARGEFDDLPGTGKPIPDLDKPHDPLWWCKRLMEREGLSYTPEVMQVRRAIEMLVARLPQMPTERHVRRRVAELNVRIVDLNRTQTSGPPSDLVPLDDDAVVARWRELRGS